MHPVIRDRELHPGTAKIDSIISWALIVATANHYLFDAAAGAGVAAGADCCALGLKWLESEIFDLRRAGRHGKAPAQGAVSQPETA